MTSDTSELVEWLRDEMMAAQQMSARYKLGSKDRDAWSTKAEKFRDAAHAVKVAPTPPKVGSEELDAAGELEALREYAKAATIAITGLTGGGSEYFGKQVGDIYTADLGRCVGRIRDILDAANERWKQARRATTTPNPNAAGLALQSRAKKAISGLVEMHKRLLITLEASGTPFLPDHNYHAWSNTVLDAMTVIGDLTHVALAAPVDHPEVVGDETDEVALFDKAVAAGRNKHAARKIAKQYGGFEVDTIGYLDLVEAIASVLCPSDSPALEAGVAHRIEHDGFEGTVQGFYVTREGKRGVVLQQIGTKVVHVYGEKWLAALAIPATESGK
jgi:hypothetical protein